MNRANQKGQGLTEYLILVMLISIVTIGAVKTLGKEIKSQIQTIRSNINREVGPSDDK